MGTEPCRLRLESKKIKVEVRGWMKKGTEDGHEPHVFCSKATSLKKVKRMVSPCLQCELVMATGKRSRAGRL